MNILHEGRNSFCLLENGVFLLEVCPNAGGSITKFQRKNLDGTRVDIFRPFKGDRQAPIDAFKTGNMTMIPFTNRISNGVLHYKGRAFTGFPLHDDEPNALHGDGYRSVWSVADFQDHVLVLTLDRRNGDTPYRYHAEQTYRLTETGLTMETVVVNKGDEMPFAIGQHPWFPAKPHTEVRADVTRMQSCDRNMHHTGFGPVPEKFDFAGGLIVSRLTETGHGFGGTAFMDNAFSGNGDRGTIIQPEQGLVISVKASLVTVQGTNLPRGYDAKNLVMYVPPKKTDGVVNDYICVEFGMPNVVDEFNLCEKGLSNGEFPILATGETYQSSITFDVHPETR